LEFISIQVGLLKQFAMMRRQQNNLYKDNTILIISRPFPSRIQSPWSTICRHKLVCDNE